MFHRFAVFSGAFGADFSALLALFIQHLLAAQEFDKRFFRAICLASSSADNARISALQVKWRHRWSGSGQCIMKERPFRRWQLDVAPPPLS